MKYNPVQVIYVTMNGRNIGRLALINRRIYFEYDTTFLETGIEISPFKLPLQAGATACEDNTFEGLFGVFNDSLPDGWGRLLLDRQVRSHGIAPEQLTPLDRLTHIGEYGMGALSYQPDVTSYTQTNDTLNLDLLAKESAQVLKGEAEDVINSLLNLAGSSGGARPKIMVGVNKTLKNIIYGQPELPDKYNHWMIKFASSNDRKDIGSIEYAYSLMAKAAGIIMPETHLFNGKKNIGYFGVKRFDREGKQRIHMHSLAGLIHSSHQVPSLDYETVLRATINLTKNFTELEKMFRLAVFNILAHNRDDHAKNFSFLMEKDGSWKVSPAYDLTFSSGPGGEQSTTILGEGKKPNRTHLIKLAEKFDIKQAAEIINEVSESIARWNEFSEKAGVSKTSSKQIGKIILSYTPSDSNCRF